MADYARSENPAVQAQLDRLERLSPAGDRLGLERIAALLDRLGRPQDDLPPVFHVAGTNGKGSVCAFLRAALEASGRSVHMFTSPHLVRFNERIRLAGKLIEDEQLALLLEEVLDASGGIEPSFFEVTTAAAFLAFARTPADACILEVGLGGRLDATNVVERPLVCGIASLGLDHQQFLGDDVLSIAREKAGIAKRGVPLVVSRYPDEVAAEVRHLADAAGAPLHAAFRSWHYEASEGTLEYRDALGTLTVPLPVMEGAHQIGNCALAIAMLRHQQVLDVPMEAFRRMPMEARWPARLQKLGSGPLVDLLSGAGAIWVDGGHNPDAAHRIADWLQSRVTGEPQPVLIVGLLANKDAEGFLRPLAAAGTAMIGVPVPGHDHHPPAYLAELAAGFGFASVGTAPDLFAAVRLADRRFGRPGEPRIAAILGSLYLAGEALAANDERPD